MKVIWLCVCLDSEPEAQGVGMRWGVGGGQCTRLKTGGGRAHSVVKHLSSVQITWHPTLSARKPLCEGAGR